MELTSNRDDAAIVRSTIDLAHSMGLKVTAEGVEDQSIQDLLATMGCDVAQGYHLSRPLPGNAFEAWLTEREQRDDATTRHAG